MEYWIYLNNEKKGPYSFDEIEQMAFPPTTLVWREGLSQWLEAKDVEELAHRFAQPMQPPTYEEENPIAEVEEDDEAEESQPEEAQIDEEASPIAEPPTYAAPQEPATTPQPTTSVEPPIECPPTYLVWAILSTLCCCQLFGIIAIIYAANVKSKYNRGDYEGAVKTSEKAALWVILSFVIGLATIPLQMVSGML